MAGSQFFPSYPWQSGQQLGAQQLDDKFKSIENLIASLSNIVAQLQVGNGEGPFNYNLNFAGGKVVTNGDYVLDYATALPIVIVSMYYGVGTAGGSFTANVRINGVSVTNMSSVNVNNTGVANIAATANNIAATGSEIDIVISNVVGSPTDAILCIECYQGTPSNTSQVVAVTDDGETLTTDSGVTIVYTLAS